MDQKPETRNSTATPCVTVVGAPWFIQVEPDQNSGLDKTSAADTFQVRSVAQQRFVRRIGLLSAPTMTAISAALAEVLEIGP